MPRYKYLLPYCLWYQYDCNWGPKVQTLAEACSLAVAKHPDASIGVNAECLVMTKLTVAKVAIRAKRTIGKTEAEICELIDREIDAFIVFRDERSPMPRIAHDFWPNYKKRTGQSLLPLVDKFIRETQSPDRFTLP